MLCGIHVMATIASSFSSNRKSVQLTPSLSIPLSQNQEKNNAAFHIRSFHSYQIIFFTLCRITLLHCISHFQGKPRKLCVLSICDLLMFIFLISWKQSKLFSLDSFLQLAFLLLFSMSWKTRFLWTLFAQGFCRIQRHSTP